MANEKFNYPTAIRDEKKTLEILGKQIPDYYQDYEDSLKNIDFIQKQTELTDNELKRDPLWQQIHDRIKDIVDYERNYMPTKHDDVYCYQRNTGHMKVGQIMKTKNFKDAKPTVYWNFDNDFDNDHIFHYLSWQMSPDGKWFFRKLSTFDKTGKQIMRSVFRDMDEEKDATTHTYVGRNFSWLPDSSGVFYNGKNLKIDKMERLWFRQEDRFHDKRDFYVAESPDEDYTFYPKVSLDNKYLFVESSRKRKYGNLLYYAKIQKEIPTSVQKRQKFRFYAIVNRWGRIYKYIGGHDKSSYLLTSYKASRNRIVEIDMGSRQPKCHCNWTTIVSKPSDKQTLIVNATYVYNKYLVVMKMGMMKPIIEFYDPKTKEILHSISFEEGYAKLGSVINENDIEMFYSFESLHIPPKIYHIKNINEFVQNKLTEGEIIFKNHLKKYSKDNYHTDFGTVEVRPDKKIPFLFVKKKNNKNTVPTLLRVNGGFGDCEFPKFCLCLFTFIDIFNGGIALANVRGGGEIGRKWWNDGRRMKKIYCIHDVESVIEYLVEHNFVNAKTTFLEGKNHGGYLAALATIRGTKGCEFGGAIAIQPLTDLINDAKIPYPEKFYYEFGNPKFDIKTLENLLRVSPLHRLENKPNNKYNALLLLCDNKDQYIPLWHSVKLTAALQYHANKSTNQTDPIFFKKFTYIYSNDDENQCYPYQYEFYTTIFVFLAKYLSIKVVR